MIVARSPLRITLGGGGTDLPSYCDIYGGFAITAAIDAHVTVILQRRPAELGIGASLSREHPVVAAALDRMDVDARDVVLSSLSDVPGGTGLGSSGSFSTAVLAALHRFRGLEIDPVGLAALAASLEIETLQLPIGRQDQYAVSLGGVREMAFGCGGEVTVTALPLDERTRDRLDRELLLFNTGIARPSGIMLADQDRRTKEADPAMLDNLHAIKDLALQARQALLDGDCDRFGGLMHQHWQIKRQRTAGMSNAAIDGWYALARAHGATGGKLVGAGAGGFLLLHAPQPRKVREALHAAGLVERRFGFVERGTGVLA